MYKELNRHETFEAAIQAVYGRTLDQLSDEFQLAMRRQYYPSVDSLAPLNVLGTEIARLAVKAAAMPDTAGDDGPGRSCTSRPPSGYVSIYRKPLEAGAGRTLSSPAGGRRELESFHPFESRMDASRPGCLLFTARYGDRDALVVWDLERDRMAGRYQFPELVSLLSPHWMPDGQSIVLSGLSESGVSDLYRVRLPGGSSSPSPPTATRISTRARAPTAVGWSSPPTGPPAGGAARPTCSCSIWTPGRSLSSPRAPGWTSRPSGRRDGRIYFTSDRDGVLNVFSVDSLRHGPPGDLGLDRRVRRRAAARRRASSWAASTT